MVKRDTCRPRFCMEEYFSGHVQAHGLVEDRFGRLRRSFVVDMEGRSQGGLFVLEESFLFDDGEETHRTWRIRNRGEGRYEAVADDIVGTAVGRRHGMEIDWTYSLRLPIGGREWVIDFDDRMYLQSGGVLINVARMRKWGILLGRITIAFVRSPEVAAA